MILADPRHEPKVRQGVTSEVVGVDGLSYAPLPSRADLAALIEMNAGLDGAPDIEADWESVAAYLERFDGRVAVNIGLLVGNSALRISRLGWEDVPADGAAVADMRQLLADSMKAGALGLSSGLDYPPGSFATTNELAALTAEAARHGARGAGAAERIEHEVVGPRRRQDHARQQRLRLLRRMQLLAVAAFQPLLAGA